MYSAKAEQAELDKVFAELEGLTGGDKKNAYAWKLQEQGFSATQTDTGYLKADTSRDDYVTLYTLDENGNEVSSEQIEYTNPELFLFDANTGSITGINRDISDDVYYDSPGIEAGDYVGEVLIIPNKINGVQVKSVALNDSILGVNTIIVPDGVETLANSCFDNNVEVEEILLPDSITNIGDYAFCQCQSLKYINIPQKITEIKMNTFYRCESLKNVIIPDKVTEISFAAFSKCFDLESVIIGNSVTTIEEYAFRRCENLKEVTIPNSVTSIGNYAFEKCYNLEEVYIPSSVTSIGSWGTFNYMKPGSIIYVENESVKNRLYKAEDNDSNYTYYNTRVIVDPTRTKGKDEPIYHYTADTSNDSYCILYTQDKYGNKIKEERVEYADSDLFAFDASTGAITGINYNFDDEHVYYEYGEGILLGNYVGETLAIPSKINGVQVKSVKLCDNSNVNLVGVKKLIISNGVTSIGSYAFRGCYGLEHVVIPNSVTSIENWAFGYCRSLKEVTIPNSVTSIEQYAFEECTSLQEVTIQNGVTSIEQYAFEDCSSLKEVTIPNSVTSIGNGAFRYCRSLQEVTIPNSVTSIGTYVFSGCSSLKEVTIPYTVTSIGNGAFSSCSSLQEITIPSGVISIGDGAFYNCRALKEITIPNNVTSIERLAFYNLAPGSTIYVQSEAVKTRLNGKYDTSKTTVVVDPSKF